MEPKQDGGERLSHCLLVGFFYVAPPRLVVALSGLGSFVPKELLEELLQHSLVGQALGDGVTKEMGIHSFHNACVFGHLLYDLLDTAL